MGTELTISASQTEGLIKPTTTELIYMIGNEDFVKLAVYEKQMTLEQAASGTTLRKLKNTINDENLTVVLVFLINRLSSNFNVGRKFTSDQAVVMAIDLIEIFGYETLEDVLLMFRMARTGRIGDGKDFKLDSQTVFHKWIPQYLELKADLRERSHNRIKEQTADSNLTLEDVKKSYKIARTKALKAERKEAKVNARIDEITKDFTREDLENLILEWEQDPIKKAFLSKLIDKRLIIN